MIYRHLSLLFATFYSILLIIYYQLLEVKDVHYSLLYAINIFQWTCAANFLISISWTFSSKVFDLFSMCNKIRKTGAVLITGCDSGFGHQLAIKCDELGYYVFAGVLFPDGDGAQILRSRCSERIRVVKMDVTKAEDVNNVINLIETSKLELSALVNNAGIWYPTPIEWGRDCDDMEKTFAVNVFGAVRVIKSCLPLLRRSKGRIVNVGSVVGEYSFIFSLY